MGRKINTCLIVLLFMSYFQSMVHSSMADLDRVITVGVDPSIPPFQYIEDGELVGFNVALLDSIAKNYDLNIEYLIMNKEIAIEKLAKDEIDLVLGLRYDTDLDNIIDYSDSVVQSVVCMLVKDERRDSVQTNLSDSYFVASVERNSTELKFLENLRRVNFNVAFNQEDAFQLLLMERADFLIGVRDTIEFLMNKYNTTNEYVIVDSYTTPVEYLIGVKEGNSFLLNLLDLGLSRLKLSGAYEELYIEWIENSPASISKRMNEIKRLSKIGGISAIILVGVIFIWNRSLKKQIRIKTKELVAINSELESQIIETKNNVKLKDLICNSSPRGIVVFDMNGEISAFNNSALKIASLSEAPIGDNIFNIEPINTMLKGKVELISSGHSSYTCKEFRYIKNNHELVYRYVMYPLYDYDKVLKGIIITIEDITEETALKDQIMEKEKNEVLTQVISGIAHEIRNPITAIKTLVELLPNKFNNPKFRDDLVRIVPNELHRVDKLIENLIDYSKPSSENIMRFNLRDTINSCVEILHHVFESNNIHINVSVSEDLTVLGDSNKIKQVIINLLLNSKEAILERASLDYYGEIDINGYVKDKVIILEFWDNGIGMDEGEIKRVFEIFYTTKENGSGLGLPISRQIIERNNATIIIESKKNNYTKITLKFPLEEKAGEVLNTG
ncbi:MAG: transporter substrate-binding domain-containing protein [Tissierellia bacterium]|nr:transporter substrate-binding domain-containing protein [Tissierellia bacterium]